MPPLQSLTGEDPIDTYSPFGGSYQNLRSIVSFRGA
jgi:hypothetical protein